MICNDCECKTFYMTTTTQKDDKGNFYFIDHYRCFHCGRDMRKGVKGVKADE